MSSTITSIGTSYPYNLVIGKLFASAMVSFVATYLPFNYFASITLISINILLGTFLVGTLPRGIMGIKGPIGVIIIMYLWFPFNVRWTMFTMFFIIK